MWQDAIQKITAFFHLGPIMVTDYVKIPHYWKAALRTLQARERGEVPDAQGTSRGVAMPSLQTGNSTWLQPYAENAPDAPLEYKPLGLGEVDGRPKRGVSAAQGTHCEGSEGKVT
ncbi:hypothetical protein F4777DRAFT_548445 [Nemania sp. FL0916]|nr:hypothetical protein F4777DRAFT_548445 [Nemania sp. FL0916]